MIYIYNPILLKGGGWRIPAMNANSTATVMLD